VIGLLAAVAAGWLAGRFVWLVTRHLFTTPALMRPNYRGTLLPSAAGIVIPLALVAVEAGRALAGAMGIGDPGGPTPARWLVLAGAFGFGLLGLLDDLAGTAGDRGFGGHLRALRDGRVTTGLVKLTGGAALAMVLVASGAGESPGRLVADAAVVALAANLANLFDRAPGRVTKVGLGAFALLAIATQRSSSLSGVAVAAGCGLALLLDDLHEHLMLGDAGANVLGAVLGLGLVVSCAPATRTAVMVVLAALNLTAELVSFSRVIDAVPPLRAIDRAGRRPS